jgi:hypothetical protein
VAKVVNKDGKVDRMQFFNLEFQKLCIQNLIDKKLSKVLAHGE